MDAWCSCRANLFFVDSRVIRETPDRHEINSSANMLLEIDAKMQFFSYRITLLLKTFLHLPLN